MHTDAQECTKMRMGKNNTTFGKKQHHTLDNVGRERWKKRHFNSCGTRYQVSQFRRGPRAHYTAVSTPLTRRLGFGFDS